MLSDIISYTLQSEALLRIPGNLFSTEPAVRALLGLVVLGQPVSLLQWGGLLAVVAASIGATSTRARSADVPSPGKSTDLHFPGRRGREGGCCLMGRCRGWWCGGGRRGWSRS